MISRVKRALKPVNKEWEPRYKEGDRVQAQYGGCKAWFYAMILSLSKVEK
jgi:hypothetical protein